MLQQTLTARMLIGFLCFTAMTIQPLQAQPPNAIQVEASPVGVQTRARDEKYPIGISEHQAVEIQERFPINSKINVRLDPTIQIGPGVIVGPNVLGGDKPLPNPLIKDVLPQDHPIITNP